MTQDKLKRFIKNFAICFAASFTFWHLAAVYVNWGIPEDMEEIRFFTVMSTIAVFFVLSVQNK